MADRRPAARSAAHSALRAWYGDGICDDFCPDPDPDCGWDPCGDKTCGDRCHVCAPWDGGYETAVVKQCQPDGTCAPSVPECDGGVGDGGVGDGGGVGGGGQCTDTCHWAGDGECADGGEGSDYSVCD